MKTTTATIVLTNKCNFNCRHCSVNAGRALENELTFKEIKVLLKKLKELNVKKIELTGGEPFLRKDLINIIKYAKKLDFRIKILTNGLLISKKKIKIFEKLGLDEVAISLEGIKYETYKKIRPVNKKTFLKVLKNIKLTSLSKIFLKINTVVTKSNINEIQEIINFCDKYKIEELRICFFTKVGRGTYLDEGINPKVWISQIKKFKSKFTKVYVGLSHFKFKSKCMLKEDIPLYISSNGNIHACPLLKPLGNIRNDNLKELLSKKIKSCLSKKYFYKDLYPVCPLKKFHILKIK